MKICKKCKEEKSLNDFRKRINSLDGYFHQCTKCILETRKNHSNYFCEPSESEKTLQKKRDKTWAENNLKRRREIVRNSRRRNYDPLIEKRRRIKRSAKKVGLTDSIRLIVLIRDRMICQKCGISVHDNIENTEDKAHIDHIVSVHNGGTNNLENLQTLCRSCNLSKGKS